MKTLSRSIPFFLTTCLLISLVSVHKINAQTVDAVHAELVAKNFFTDLLARSRISTAKGILGQDLVMLLAYEADENMSAQNDIKKGSQSIPLYFIFNVKDKTDPKGQNGFIIISGDKRVPAVLGYSFTGEFSENDQAPAFIAWMDNYKKQIRDAIQNNLTPDSKIIDKWKELSGTIELKGTEQINEVAPLLVTKWAQRGYHNNLCPADNRCTSSLNGHVPAGCTAIAMAQIMYHHKYPASNNPIPGYTDDLNYFIDGNPIPNSAYGIPDVGETVYDWQNMVADINWGLYNHDIPRSPAEMVAINAVSTLIYHCGVAVQMDYSPYMSGSGSPLTAFVDYFKYSPFLEEISKSSYSDDDWAGKLKTELNASRPVYYAGYRNDALEGGHAFVCDGYQDVDPLSLGRFFHFCWGEGGGGSNGYFNLDDLTPGTGDDDYTFMQCAIIGITPDPELNLADADGNRYNIIEIGTQWWMAENLKTTKFNDGTIIPLITDNSVWPTLTTPGYGWYDNDITNKDIYGALYNWYTVQSGKLCPDGWHVPTDEDWTTLSEFLGGPHVAGGKLKEAGTLHWKDPNTGATDDYEFTALPGGYRHPEVGEFGGKFYNLTHLGFWWSSTRFSTTNAYVRIMGYDNTSVSPQTAGALTTGASVRCLKGPLVETIPGKTGAFAYGFIGTEGEENWFRYLTGDAGAYAIQTYGTTDTYMYLYDSDQTTLLAEDNDASGSGKNSKIVQNLSADTWYYVKIRGYDNSVTGSYSINFVPLPAAPTAEDQTVCSDGTGNQTLIATATAPEGSSVVWFTTPDGSVPTENPIQTGVGSITYYAASYNGTSECYSMTRTPVTLTINGLPTAAISGTALICEGNSAELSLSFTGEPPWRITYTDGTTPVTLSGISVSPYLITVAPFATTTYSLLAVGDANCSQELSGISAFVTINSKPEITGITADQVDPVPLQNEEATVYITAGFSDVDNNLISVAFNFGDGSSPETTALAGTETSIQVSHTYSKTGVFVIEVTLSDECSSVSMPYNYVVIYDPAGGFVTGGGWIVSPAGAYVPDPALMGKATFGFESRYKKGANVPSGNTEFQFHAAGMNFKSQSYEWLVVAGSKARFKGSGTINDAGCYSFMLSAIDGTPDKFRIRIRDLETETIVYDNEMSASDVSEPITAISGGSISVHSPKGKYNIMASDFGIKAYPNPFSDHIYFDIRMMIDSEVTLEIFDADGSKIATVYNDIVVAYENYTFEYVPENLRSGILIYRFTVNGKQMFSGRLIHH